MTDGLPFLPFARPSMTTAEREAVLQVLDSGWLTTGPRTHEFEARFADFVGARHAVALNSATAGLHLALEALGIGPGDEVIVPTWTFTSTAEVITYQGAHPVLIDVDPESLNVTPELVLDAVTPRTRAVMVVHIAGAPAKLRELVDALDPLGIPLVEDAAHAFPSRISPDGRLAGTMGRAGVFSFYATKTITTGEGGMLVTDDDAIAARAQLMSLHGITRGADTRYAAEGSWFYEVEAAGFKYNMTDIAAAIGLAQLARADELLDARRSLQAQYRAAFHASPVAELIELPSNAAGASHAWHLFIVRLRLDRMTLARAAVIEALREHGIGTSVHFIPLHRHPYYRDRWGARDSDFPVATAEFDRVISLPIWPGMTDDDVERVVNAFSAILVPG
jgi:dTDP-4-amino-4,6-dideoxygalactose transaminase